MLKPQQGHAKPHGVTLGRASAPHLLVMQPASASEGPPVHGQPGVAGSWEKLRFCLSFEAGESSRLGGFPRLRALGGDGV